MHLKIKSLNRKKGKKSKIKMNSKNKNKKTGFLACNNLLQSLDSQSDCGGDSGQKT